jgi:pimeloyl-ACP methyl ester carboxylesterase
MKLNIYKIIIAMGLLSFLSCSFNKFYYVPNKEHTNIEVDSVSEGFIDTRSGNKIHYVYSDAVNKNAKTTLFILHGNAGNLGGWSGLIPDLRNASFNVFMIDYQGFGKSEGKPTHNNILEDAETALEFALKMEQIKETKIVVLGLSIGGQLGITLASKRPELINAVAVEGTFTSHLDIALALVSKPLKPIAKAFMKKSYIAKDEVKNLKCPFLVLHSKDDRMIPFWMGETLYKNANEPKIFQEIQGEHLAGISENYDIYIKKLNELVNMIQ